MNSISQNPKNETKIEAKSLKVWGESGKEFTIISNYFLKPKYYKQLGLTQGEKTLIEVILSYKHTSGDPFPSMQTLADDFATDRSNIKKMVKSIEKKGLVIITRLPDKAKGNLSNRYNFSPLIKALNKLTEGVGVNFTPTPGGEINPYPGGEINPPKKNFEKENVKKKNNYINMTSNNLNNSLKSMIQSIIQNDNVDKSIFDYALIKSINNAWKRYPNKDNVLTFKIFISEAIKKSSNSNERGKYLMACVNNAIEPKQNTQKENMDKNINKQKKPIQTNEVTPDWFAEEKHNIKHIEQDKETWSKEQHEIYERLMAFA